MGKFATNGPEMADAVWQGTLSAAGPGTGNTTDVGAPGGGSGYIVLFGNFNASLWGTFVATVQLERSFDGGTTWLACAQNTAGAAAAYTAPVSVVGNEPEKGVLYRWNCTSYTSGTVNFRLSQSHPLPAEYTDNA